MHSQSEPREPAKIKVKESIFLGGGGVGEPPMIKSIINQREGGSKVSQSNYVFCTYCVM